MLTTTGALWLPFTQMDEFDPSQRCFVRGEGEYLIDSRGRRVFDAVSSIWTTIHGHCRPEIVEAIARQARILDHATLLGATNPVAEALAGELAALLRLGKIFFSSDGASAVEAALKIALQYWQNAGEPQRTRFVHLIGGYHGDTAAAMSVSDIPLFKSRFGTITFSAVPYDRWDADDPDVAAVIVEPIVQAAAGMRIVDPAMYEPLKQMTPLLIVDEIATGFGRTGTMFAFEQLALAPDIVCLGKGLSGGTLALSATALSDEIADMFGGTHSGMRHFFHGHSYAGNPIACAAARANLEIFAAEKTLSHVAAVSQSLQTQLAPLRTHPLVRDIRQCGLMCAIEITAEKIDRGSSMTPAWRIADALYDSGHFTRPLGDAVQLVPPLSSSAGQLQAFVDDVTVVLESAA